MNAVKSDVCNSCHQKIKIVKEIPENVKAEISKKRLETIQKRKDSERKKEEEIENLKKNNKHLLTLLSVYEKSIDDDSVGNGASRCSDESESENDFDIDK